MLRQELSQAPTTFLKKNRCFSGSWSRPSIFSIQQMHLTVKIRDFTPKSKIYPKSKKYLKIQISPQNQNCTPKIEISPKNRKFTRHFLGLRVSRWPMTNRVLKSKCIRRCQVFWMVVRQKWPRITRANSVIVVMPVYYLLVRHSLGFRV